MASNMLMEQVKNAILQHTRQQNAQSGPFDPKELLQTIETLFGQHRAAQNQPQGMDPYGGLPDEAGDLPPVDPHSVPSD